ncbi:MAG: DUF2628 domain-containing protein [Nitrospirae bacterium]|nr:MAG: DUF2628 domain-containing protein [Nitrospirota bacterium]
MKPCAQCEQQNPDDARFCSQCGALFAEEPAPSTDQPAEKPAPPILDEQQLWRSFIGQNADRYLEQFRKFTGSGEPRFTLTWHWPAFLFDPFLWFLYRKMYLYAAVYAIGPVLSAYFTGDLTVGVVWRVMAGASANYIYYWHVREHVAIIKEKASLGGRAQEQSLKDLGGVQPYVVWVGVALHILMFALLIKAYQEGPSEGTKLPPLKPVPRSRASLES